jgi:hypothetical protein
MILRIINKDCEGNKETELTMSSGWEELSADLKAYRFIVENIALAG